MKRYLLSVFLLLILSALGSSAFAIGFQMLPSNLKRIEEEAFLRNVSIQRISIPDGTLYIGTRAFADSNLLEIELPNSLEYIASDAFSGCEELVAYVEEGSYAQGYCEQNGIDYKPMNLSPRNFSCKSIDGGASYMITLYRGTSTDITIPDTIYGKPVTALRSDMFYDKENIHSVSIPDSVIQIETNTFSGCSNLQKVVLPKGLKTIPSFDGCKNLEEIVWPDNYTSFESFYGCSKLKSFQIPEGMTTIPSWAFSGCSSLTEINIPEGVTKIMNYAFSNCSAITKVDIPEGILTIDMNVFENCTSLTDIVLPESIVSMGSGVFRNCPLLTVQVAENSYTESYCRSKNLKYHTVGTANLDPLFETEQQEDGSCRIVNFTGNHTYLKIPDIIHGMRVSAIGDGAFARKYLVELIIPEGVTSIGSSAFNQCLYLQSISLPSTLKRIGEYAFNRNDALQEIILPQSATDLGRGAFAACSALTHIVLPDALTEISPHLFVGCSSLENIDIPSGVIQIGEHAFRSCTLLRSPVLPQGLQEIGHSAFSACSALEELIFPESLKKIDDFAYAYCKNLYLAIISAGVQDVGSRVFEESPVTVITERNSAALEACKTDKTLFIIEPNAESDFTTVKISDTACRITGYKGTQVDVFLPETIGGLVVEKISASAFKDNKKIESLSVLNSVHTIGNKAFMNCTALRYAVISDGVTNIADNAFDGCSNLETILVITMEHE